MSWETAGLNAEGDDPGQLESAGPLGDGPYTVAQVAKILGVSDRHIYDLVKEGRISNQRHA